MANSEETQKLLGVVDASEEANKKISSGQPTAIAVADSQEERDWDGNLLQCCGSDRHGLSAFASTLLCMPCTMVHNVRAALPGKSVRRLILLLCLAATVHFCYNIQAQRAFHACEPFHPGLPHDPHHPGQPQQPGLELEPEPQTKTFLAGATFNPAFLENEDEPSLDMNVDSQEAGAENSGFVVMVNGVPMEMGEAEATNAQIMQVKNEAMEGMNQIAGMGRKLLHKHHDDDHKHEKHHHDDEDSDDDDDDNDDHEDDHDDDDHEDDDDCDHKSITGAKTFEAQTEDEDFHHHHHGPVHHHKEGPEDIEECKRQQGTFVILFYAMEFCWAAFIVYGYRMRKTMRKVLNIRGSNFKDCMAWVFCTPCAVCQETRTITKNNVVNGAWHNPTMFVSPVTQEIEEEPSAAKLPV